VFRLKGAGGFSLGMSLRLGIAAALLGEPHAIEPTNMERVAERGFPPTPLGDLPQEPVVPHKGTR